MDKRRIAIVVALLGIVGVLAGAWWWRGRDRRPTAPAASGSIGTAAPGRDGVAPGPAAGIDGVVIDQAGAAVAGALVRAARRHGEPVTTSTDGQGHFRVDAPAGAYVVTASALDRAPASAEIVVAAASRAEVRLTLGAATPTLRGQVHDLTGGPVAGALVTFARSAGVLASDDQRAVATLSDGEGRFALALAPGAYLVATAHPDYLRDARAIDVGTPPSPLEIELAPGGVVEGVVRRRPDGAPVAGAHVSYAHERVAGGALGGMVTQGGGGSVTADPSGRFRIGGLGAGRVVLDARSDDAASVDSTDVELGIAETASGIEVWIEAAPAIAGVVRYQDGAPAAGAEVTALTGGDAMRVEAEDDGRFRIVGMPAGAVQLRAQAEDTLPGPLVMVTVPAAGPGPSPVVLVVERGQYVRGRVEPPGVADITVDSGPTSPMDGADGILALTVGPTSARSDADGNFRIGPLAPGPTTLVGRAADGRRGQVALTAPTDEQVVLRLEELGRISGRVVTRTGAPVGGGTVSVRRADDRRTVIVNGRDVGADRAPVGADGRFTIAGRAPGTWLLTPLDERGGARAIDRVGADRDQPMRVELVGTRTLDVDVVVEAADGEIAGVVVGSDGAPVADAWVTVSLRQLEGEPAGRLGRPGPPGGGPRPDGPPPQGPGPGGDGPPGEGSGDDADQMIVVAEVVSGGGADHAGAVPPVLTGADGRFRVRGLRRGRYDVAAEGQRGGARGQVSDVATGSQTKVTVVGLARVRGVVLGSDGEPAAGADVWSEGPTRKRRKTDGRGGFELRGLDPGAYVLTAGTPTATGKTQVALEVGASSEVTIRMVDDAMVRGRLVDPAGAPVAGRVVIVGERSDEVSIFGPPERSGPDGRFAVASPAGPRRLMVLGPRGPLVMQDIEVAPGQALDLGDVVVKAEPAGPPPGSDRQRRAEPGRGSARPRAPAPATGA